MVQKQIVYNDPIWGSFKDFTDKQLDAFLKPGKAMRKTLISDLRAEVEAGKLPNELVEKANWLLLNRFEELLREYCFISMTLTVDHDDHSKRQTMLEDKINELYSKYYSS